MGEWVMFLRRGLAVRAIILVGLMIGCFIFGALCFHGTTGSVPARASSAPDKIWADKAARLMPGTYWAGTGASKVTLTLSSDKSTGSINNLVIIGVKPLFFLAYSRRSRFYGVPVILMRSGGFKHGQAWLDVGVRGRLLIKYVGGQGFARWHGKWFKVKQGTPGTIPFVEFGGALHRYDPATGDWEIVPDRMAPVQ